MTFITDGVDSIPTNVSQVMSVPPQFYGGMGAMDKFIIDNLRYPAEAWNDTTYKKKDVFGCYCVIRKDGRAVFPRPTNMHPALSGEIARVVSLMPSWKPAEKGRTRQTLWSAVQMLTQKLCCQTIHDCPKVVPLHYESE